MELLQARTATLKPHPENAHYFKDINGSQWEQFVENVRDMGIIEPLIVNGKSKEVISGNQRLRAAIEVGLKTVPCVYVNPDTEDTEIADMISTNVFRRQLDAFQAMALVKVLRERIKPRGPGGRPSEENPGVGRPGLVGPQKQIAKALKKDKAFVSAADLYNSLSQDQQQELREWFYSQEKRPTDADLATRIRLEKDIEAKTEEIRGLRERNDSKEEIMQLKEEVRALKAKLRGKKETDLIGPEAKYLVDVARAWNLLRNPPRDLTEEGHAKIIKVLTKIRNMIEEYLA